MFKMTRCAALAVCWVFVTVALAQGVAGESATARVGDDRIAAGSSLRLTDRTAGDLLAAGGRVDLRAPVDGDVVLAGGELRLQSAVAHNVYAAGGRLWIEGALARHLRVAGGQIDLAPGAQIAGNATVFGGDVAVRSPIKGSLRVAAGRVLIDAAIDGDVSATAGRIELGPQARIGGALRWRSGSDLQRNAAAKVQGPEQRLATPGSRGGWAGHGHERAWHGGWLAGLWWTAGLMLMTAATLALFPSASAKVARTLRERGGRSLLLGFIVLVCVPVAAVLLLISVIGAPLALLLFLAYFGALLLGYGVSAMALGDWALDRIRPGQGNRLAWRIGAASLALLLLAWLSVLPWLGGWIVLIAMLAGLGALALQLGSSSRVGVG